MNDDYELAKMLALERSQNSLKWERSAGRVIYAVGGFILGLFAAYLFKI